MRGKGSVRFVATVVTLALVAQISQAGAQNVPTPTSVPPAAGASGTAGSTPSSETPSTGLPAPAPTPTPTPTQTPPTTGMPATPPSAGASALSQDDMVRRTNWIQAQLDAEQPAAQRWFWIWTGATIAFTAGQAAMGVVFSLPGFLTDEVVTPHPGDPNAMLAAERYTSLAREQWRQWAPPFFVGAVSSLLSFIPFIIFPFSPGWLGNRLRAVRGETAAQTTARFQLAERLLREGAETEEFGRSWVMHLINAAVAVAGTAVIWFAWPNPYAIANGFISFGMTLGFAELQMATQPADLIALNRAYRAGDIDFNRMPVRNAAPRVSVMPYLSPTGAGFGLRF